MQQPIDRRSSLPVLTKKQQEFGHLTSNFSDQGAAPGWEVPGAGSLATDELFSRAYDQLRRLARRYNRTTGTATLTPTALVHEAYLKLARSGNFQAKSPDHLVHTVVRAMRHIVVDSARRRGAQIHGGGAVERGIDLDQFTAQCGFDPTIVLAVDQMLTKMAQQNGLRARIFECHHFGGLTLSEIAASLAISTKTAQRHLQIAIAEIQMTLVPPRGGPAADG
jgi:RNA polymerase sigma factor (TIGR02999 family)